MVLLMVSYLAVGIFSFLLVGYFKPDTNFFLICLTVALLLAFVSIYSLRKNIFFIDNPHIQTTKFLFTGIITCTVLWFAILCYGLGTAWTLTTGTERIVAMRITEKSSGSPRRRRCDFYIKAEGVTENIKFETCLSKAKWNVVFVGNEINISVKSTSLGFINDLLSIKSGENSSSPEKWLK